MLHHHNTQPFGTQLGQQVSQSALFKVPQPGSGLVEQEHGGLACQSARDFNNALLAQCQRRSRCICVGCQAATGDLTARFVKQRGFFNAVKPQHRGHPATLGTAVCAQRDILDHTALAEQPHMLKSPAQAQRCKGP